MNTNKYKPRLFNSDFFAGLLLCAVVFFIIWVIITGDNSHRFGRF